MALSLAALLIAILLATLVGSTAIAPSELLASLGRALARVMGLSAPASTAIAAGPSAGHVDVIVFGIRLPRVLLAAAVGGSLGLAGAVFQGVFRNPLADPFLLGTASGAGLGSAVAVLAPFGLFLAGRVTQPLVAFAFALGTVVLVVVLARHGGSLPVVRLILAGVVVSSMLSAVTSFLMVAAREQAATILNQLLGGFGLATWPDVVVVTLFLLPAGGVALLLARSLDVLQLGDEGAAHLGLPVETLRFTLLAAATFVTAAAVSVAGIIGFVGLMTPHAVRSLVGPRHGPLLALSLLWGAVFMVCADLLARTLIAPAEVPVGVITAVFGGPLFLALLRRTGSW